MQLDFNGSKIDNIKINTKELSLTEKENKPKELQCTIHTIQLPKSTHVISVNYIKYGEYIIVKLSSDM